MILPTMNSEELVREIIKDFPAVMQKAKYAMEELRRPAIKSRNKQVRRIRDYKSKNKNNWLIFCDYHVKDPMYYVVVHFIDKWGLQAYLVDENQRLLYHYNGHLLERYNERFLKEPELSKMELLKRYLSANASPLIEVHPETKEYKHPIFGKAEEGVVFGNIEIQGIWKVFHIRTFISNDMIHEGQQETFDATSELYKQCWEEVYGKRN